MAQSGWIPYLFRIFVCCTCPHYCYFDINTCMSIKIRTMGKPSAPDCRAKAPSCHAYLPRYYQTCPSLCTFYCTLKSQSDNTLPVDLVYLRSRKCMANGVYKCVCVIEKVSFDSIFSVILYHKSCI